MRSRFRFASLRGFRAEGRAHCDRAVALYDAHFPRRVTDLAIGGDDLVRAGVRPGPAMGRILTGALDAVTDGVLVNDRATLLTWAKGQSA